MQQTTNYALKKIDLADSPPDITVLNPNFDTIDAELKSIRDDAAEHKAESVMQVKNITRDLQIAGVQTVVFDKPVKGVIALGAVNDSEMMAIGATDKSNSKGVLTKIGTFYNFSFASLLFQLLGSGNYTTASTVANGNNIDITWSKTGTGAIGTAGVTLIAFF